MYSTRQLRTLTLVFWLSYRHRSSGWSTKEEGRGSVNASLTPWRSMTAKIWTEMLTSVLHRWAVLTSLEHLTPSISNLTTQINKTNSTIQNQLYSSRLLESRTTRQLNGLFRGISPGLYPNLRSMIKRAKIIMSSHWPKSRNFRSRRDFKTPSLNRLSGSSCTTKQENGRISSNSWCLEGYCCCQFWQYIMCYLLV